MTVNVGTIDRIIRLIAGLALIALPFVANQPIFEQGLYKYGSIVIGVVLVATSAMRFCPIYGILGLRTCKG